MYYLKQLFPTCFGQIENTSDEPTEPHTQQSPTPASPQPNMAVPSQTITATTTDNNNSEAQSKLKAHSYANVARNNNQLCVSARTHLAKPTAASITGGNEIRTSSGATVAVNPINAKASSQPACLVTPERLEAQKRARQRYPTCPTIAEDLSGSLLARRRQLSINSNNSSETAVDEYDDESIATKSTLEAA